MKSSFQRKIQRKSKKQVAGSDDAEDKSFANALCKQYDNFNGMNAATMRENFNGLPEACSSDRVTQIFDMVKILDTGLWDLLLDSIREAHANHSLRDKVKEIINRFAEGTTERDFLSKMLAYETDITDDKKLEGFESISEYYRNQASGLLICSPTLLKEFIKDVSDTSDDDLYSHLSTGCVGQQAGRRSRQNRRRSYRKRM